MSTNIPIAVHFAKSHLTFLWPYENLISEVFNYYRLDSSKRHAGETY